MARERNPNDPYYEDPAANDLRRPAFEDAAANDPRRPYEDAAANELRRSPRLDQELQADPELTEGRISGGRIAAVVAAIFLLIGALYYGMNMSSTPTSTATQTAPASQTNAQNANPAIRDVTPKRDAGTTTGSAQSPASPPSNSSTSPSR